VIGPGVAAECREAKGAVHVFDDHFRPEVVDPETGEPTAGAGELVLTTLTKEALPVLRCRTGDVTEFVEGECPCGHTHRRIARFSGRVDDMLVIRGVNVLLVIELRIWHGGGEAIVVPEAVVVHETVDVAGPAGRVAGQQRTRADWEEAASDEALRFVHEFVHWTEQNLGEVRVDYSPQSYIGVRRGRRVWAPLWLRTDGAMVYLPDPDGSREEQQSVAYDHFEERLRAAGLEPA
jgi:hypothetical protein